jgi:PAS domain S-box-containing protein
MDHLVAATTYRDMFECMSDALIFADTQGIIRIWNKGAEDLFGFTAAEAGGRSLDLIIPEHLRQAHWEGFHKAVGRGATLHGRRSMITRSLHKSGQQLYVDMSFAVARNSGSEITGSIAIARNATERFLEEKTLRRQLAALTAKQST